MTLKYDEENVEQMYDTLKFIKQIYLSAENDTMAERSSAFYEIGSMVCHLLAEMKK